MIGTEILVIRTEAERVAVEGHSHFLPYPPSEQRDGIIGEFLGVRIRVALDPPQETV